MRSKRFIFTLVAVFGTVILMNGCGKKGCPEGMHEETIAGGQIICVPDDLGKR
ncbi:hypothetical protein SAMN04488101_1089 [Pedobacter nyackensis]|uniref:Uncharacterized protein n=1 Tax=Pedobacter nyackensis TaxID=475255 RepID=A0A1W2DRW3_9SPHI|nr:hypothetical protein SAMN04488101_1089 [Pedobacter nyackensis]